MKESSPQKSLWGADPVLISKVHPPQRAWRERGDGNDGEKRHPNNDPALWIGRDGLHEIYI